MFRENFEQFVADAGPDAGRRRPARLTQNPNFSCGNRYKLLWAANSAFLGSEPTRGVGTGPDKEGVMKGRTKVAMVLISAALTVLATNSGAPADSAATCLGERATIVGTEGDDLIAGTSKRRRDRCARGNDVINAHGGDDLVCAGDGNDRIDARRRLLRWN